MRNVRVTGAAIERAVVKRGVQRQLREALGLTEQEEKRLYLGMLLLPYRDVCKVAELCQVPVELLVEPDPKEHEAHMTQQYGAFTDPENREFILDLIEDYITIKNSVCTHG